jgi:flagellar hook-associated protein FlgK
MKPVVLKAQVKELNAYIKGINDLNQEVLLETQKKLLKIQLEVNEYLSLL